jgi:hypothetical protein
MNQAASDRFFHRVPLLYCEPMEAPEQHWIPSEPPPAPFIFIETRSPDTLRFQFLDDRKWHTGPGLTEEERIEHRNLFTKLFP